MEGGRLNAQKKRKETAEELSAKRVSKNLIQDETRSCLCTINFPPNEGFCLSPECFNSNRVMKVAGASFVCAAAGGVNMLGKQTWLGLLPGSKKEKTKSQRKHLPNRDLAAAKTWLMSSGDGSRTAARERRAPRFPASWWELRRGGLRQYPDSLQTGATNPNACRGQVGGVREGRGRLHFST